MTLLTPTNVSHDRIVWAQLRESLYKKSNRIGIVMV